MLEFLSEKAIITVLNVINTCYRFCTRWAEREFQVWHWKGREYRVFKKGKGKTAVLKVSSLYRQFLPHLYMMPHSTAISAYTLRWTSTIYNCLWERCVKKLQASHSWADFMNMTWTQRRDLHHCGFNLSFRVYQTLRIMETANKHQKLQEKGMDTKHDHKNLSSKASRWT